MVHKIIFHIGFQTFPLPLFDQLGPFRSVIPSSLGVRLSNRWFRFLFASSSFHLWYCFVQKHFFTLFASLIILQFFGGNSCSSFRGVQQLLFLYLCCSVAVNAWLFPERYTFTVLLAGIIVGLLSTPIHNILLDLRLVTSSGVVLHPWSVSDSSCSKNEQC